METDIYVLRPSLTGQLAKEVGPPDWEFDARLTREGQITDPPELAWRWLDEAPVQDWARTTDMARLVSPRMRAVLEDHLGERDVIQWLPATLTTPTGEDLPYWVMHFPVFHDVLHSSTNWGPSGLPIRWVLDRAKLDGHHVFIVPKLNNIIIVTGKVLVALVDAGLTGFSVERARIA